MNAKLAVALLDQLDMREPECAHGEADDILLDWARDNGGKEVAKAYDAVVNRAPWWACA